MSGINNKDEEDPKKMRPLQKLYPEAIYSFHRAFREIWTNYGYRGPKGEKIVSIAASLFSKHTRTFHWLAVSDWGIKQNDIKDIFDDVKKKDPTDTESDLKIWKAFEGNLNTGHVSIETKRAIKDISKILEFRTTNNNEIASASRHLYTLYEGYHHDPTLYLDGIVYRNLKKLHQSSNRRKTKIDYYYGTFFEGKEVKGGEEGTHFRFRWINVKFEGIDDEGKRKELPIPYYQCQELEKQRIAKDGILYLTNTEKDDINLRPGLGIAAYLNEKIFYKDKVKEIIEVRGSHILVIPLYDVWIGKEAWGSLCGNLLLFFKDGNSLKCFMTGSWILRLLNTLKCFSTISPTSSGYDSQLDKFRGKCQQLSQELTKSGTQLLLKEFIEPPYNIVDHFVKNLKILQDWERIIVYQGKIAQPQYSYYWWRNPEKEKENEPEWKQYEWKRCACVSSTLGNVSCDKCPPWKEVEKDVEKKYLRWEHDFWDSSFLPDISDEEKNTFGGIRLAFEYPITACIPNDANQRKALGEEYIRQQLEVLRGLMPKVRARRAALRSAVSAIMGRNMSHNIGSHVLARYSSAIRDDLVPAQKGTTDHRTDFLSYLQRRMDFLAEMGTSDEAFWSQPLSMKQQISRLNYGDQKNRFIGESSTRASCEKQDCPGKMAIESPSVSASSLCNESCSDCTYRLSLASGNKVANDPIILSFITGKESLLASVEYGKPDILCPGDNGFCKGGYVAKNQNDFWFGCPGGEVGVHALFVILENIIRNSARHGTEDNKGIVRIFVEIDQEGSTENLLKLVIIDPRSQLKKDGRIIDSEGKCKHTEEGATDENDKLNKLKDGRRGLQENGKRKKLVCLNNDINSILWDEPFLDENGNPNPHYWGMREMQICANYLRGVSLSDLEGIRNDSMPILEAVVKELPDKTYCLAYEFYVQRAKLMAVVTTQEITADRAHLLERGISIIPVVTKPAADDVKQWHQIIDAARGYGFVALTHEIGFPGLSVLPSLPMRTHQIDVKCVGKVLADSLSNKDNLKWMECLYIKEGRRYREKRPQWNNGEYWGLNAQMGLDKSKEIKEGAWRQVRLNLQQNVDDVAGGTDRIMWPLNDNDIAIVGLLNKDIAAIWIDHPKPECFKRNNELGTSVCLEQAAIPPLGNNHIRWIQVEGVFSDSPHKVALQASDESYCQELLTAALPRVVVLDERVQSGANTAIRDIPLRNLWSSMGVWVPVKDGCDLDNPELMKVGTFLEKPTEHSEQLPIDFLILHLTVLERLHKARAEASNTFAETLDNLIKGTQAECAQVVVVTGRGVPAITNQNNPDYLPNARYLPVSAILEYLVARPSKLSLMRVLWSAARPASN